MSTILRFQDSYICRQLLKIVHKPEGNQQQDAIPFEVACFDAEANSCAAIDAKSFLYVINFRILEYTAIPMAQHAGTAAAFHPDLPNTIVLGTAAGELLLIDSATGQILQSAVQVSSQAIRQLYWPAKEANHLLVLTEHNRLILCHSHTLQRLRRIAHFSASDCNVLFNPTTNTLFAVRGTEILCKSVADSSESATFDALDSMNNFLRHNQPVIINETSAGHSQPDDFDDRIRQLDVTAGGRQMCVCFGAGILLLGYSSSSSRWLPQHFVRIAAQLWQCHFLSAAAEETADSGQMLLVTSQSAVCLVDLERRISLKLFALGQQPTASAVRVFAASASAQPMLATIAAGSLRIWSKATMGAPLRQHRRLQEAASARSAALHLQRQLSALLPVGRLHSLLAEFHQYPATHRPLIWHTLLQLPRNRVAFDQLLQLGPHPCTAHFARTYPLRDATAARHLRRIVSALAHWSPALATVAHLPRFVFPFLRVFRNDTRAAFETIATLWLNHGQLWLEFGGAAPPLNYHAICVGLLEHFEPQLARYYRDQNVTAALYVGSLLEAAFTEVLDEQQWLQLWDAVCSRPPWWLAFAVVAFSGAQRVAIEAAAQCERVFAEHASQLRIAAMAALADRWAAQCPRDLHPKRYVREFRALGEGGGEGGEEQSSMGYRRLGNYPVFVEQRDGGEAVDGERSTGGGDVRLLNERLLQMERIKAELEAMQLGDRKRSVHEERLAEAERLYSSSALLLGGGESMVPK